MAKVLLNNKVIERDGEPAQFYGFAYDGCHKIYLLEHREDFREALSLGYKPKPLSELRAAWYGSCPLRFISTWSGLHGLVGQFQYCGDMECDEADIDDVDTRLLTIEIVNEPDEPYVFNEDGIPINFDNVPSDEGCEERREKAEQAILDGIKTFEDIALMLKQELCAEDAFEFETQKLEPKPAPYNIAFRTDEGDDETQLNIDEGEDFEDLKRLWFDFCKENDFDPKKIISITEGVEE